MSNAFYDLDEQIRWNRETRERLQELVELIAAVEQRNGCKMTDDERTAKYPHWQEAYVLHQRESIDLGEALERIVAQAVRQARLGEAKWWDKNSNAEDEAQATAQASRLAALERQQEGK